MSGRLQLRTTEFVLDIPGEWEQLESDDPAQMQFESPSLKAAFVIAQRMAAIPPDALLSTIEQIMQARLDALKSGAPGEVSGKRSVVQEDLGLAHAIYHTRDAHGFSRFDGWATKAKVLQLWSSVESEDEEAARKILDDVVTGFTLYVP